ncbi:hypothetical protein HanHA300_Chr03g0114551 [Helianthus annuus]|nr:hypothetical protein HanHA300_Chr03g0114551 [Helianthus annuus]
MGGKGKKRREKNYKEAHGVGKNRLPPPPVRSSLDVIPSKLRKLMSYTSGQKLSTKKKPDSVSSESKIEDTYEIDNFSTEKKKKKRKRKQVDDLRFVAELGAVGSKRKERKKKYGFNLLYHVLLIISQIRGTKITLFVSYKINLFECVLFSHILQRGCFIIQIQGLGLNCSFKIFLNKDMCLLTTEYLCRLLEERKKKHKKAKQEDDLNFPGCEEIKFGEVVQAPPKLVNVPKRFGSSVNASQERIRLRTIEAYRDQKKWASRPGLHLPTTDLTHHNNVVLPVEK